MSEMERYERRRSEETGHEKMEEEPSWQDSKRSEGSSKVPVALIVFVLVVGAIAVLALSQPLGPSPQRQPHIINQPVPTPPPPPVDNNKRLRDALNQTPYSIIGNGYKIVRHYIQNLVWGPDGKPLQGKWYEVIIDTTQAAKQMPLYFKPGRYVVQDDISFRDKIECIRRDWIRPDVNYNLFVEGTADKLSWDASMIDRTADLQPVTVSVLMHKPPPSDPNVFIDQEKTVTIPVEFKNEHLPNLRGYFMQSRLNDAGLTHTRILDGSVTEQINPQDRNVRIFLFLPEYTPRQE